MQNDRMRLCGYSVVRRLGADSHLAHDERGRAIVIKKLNESALLQGRLHPAIRDRLMHVQGLPLPNVATLLGVEREGGSTFLVWTFVEGKTLTEHLRKSSPQAMRAVKLELRRMMDALHAAGVVHGAIHGGNVIVDDRGELHLTHISPLLFHDPEIDRLGVAKILPPKALDDENVQKSLRRVGDPNHRLSMIAAAIGLALLGALIAMQVLRTM